MELNKLTLGIIVLFAVLFFGPVLLRESFVDASDNSGSMVSVSLRDLMTLIGIGVASGNTTTGTTSTATTNTATTGTTTTSDDDTGSFASQFYESIRGELLSDVRQSVRKQLQDQQEDILDDSCIDGMANQQGADWMRYIPGKNPADYIRKDSIPCYKCNL